MSIIKRNRVVLLEVSVASTKVVNKYRWLTKELAELVLAASIKVVKIRQMDIEGN